MAVKTPAAKLPTKAFSDSPFDLVAIAEAGRKSSFQKKHRQPETIGGILETAFRSPVVRKKVKEYAAFPYWEQIVGEKIAAVAIPEKISRGKVLRIRVMDAVWAQELSLMKQQIIEGMHRFGRGAIVEDVKFTIGNPKSFKKE